MIVLVGCLAVIATSLARRAHAGDPGCASLGNAAAFVVFSDGAFNSSQASGTSISGRIAAAGDVTLDGISVSPAAGDSTPTVVAGGDFIAGRTTGHGGTLNGGVQYGGAIDVFARDANGAAQIIPDVLERTLDIFERVGV